MEYISLQDRINLEVLNCTKAVDILTPEERAKLINMSADEIRKFNFEVVIPRYKALKKKMA